MRRGGLHLRKLLEPHVHSDPERFSNNFNMVLSITGREKDAYLLQEEARVSGGDICTAERRAGFGSKDVFVNWFLSSLRRSDFKCEYCNTSVFAIQKLIKAGLLKPRNSRGNGIRGMNLEVERKNNDKGYNMDNCALACFLCNNDKSSVVDSEHYLRFMAAGRRNYIDHLMTLLK